MINVKCFFYKSLKNLNNFKNLIITTQNENNGLRFIAAINRYLFLFKFSV